MSEASGHREMGTEDFLHRFFSPFKVPEELLPDEVNICIKLYPRKTRINNRILTLRERELRDQWLQSLQEDYILLESHRESLSKLFGESAFRMTPETIAGAFSKTDTLSYNPVSLPVELRQDPMTRESFAQGIQILITQMEALER